MAEHLHSAFADHSFGRVAPFQLGVEEELILVDPVTHALSHTSQDVLTAMGAPPEVVQLEFYAALIEFASPICRDAVEAAAAIGRLRAAMRETGAVAIGSGLHPASAYADVKAVPKPRWLAVADVHGRANFRSVEAALHVHIGMPDPQTAMRAFNGLREDLPLLLALSANSPFWFGTDSGLASARTVQNRAFSRFDLPAPFDTYDAYAERVDAVLSAGELADYTMVWWHVRLHPRLGTVEVRVMDSQSLLGRVAGLATLVHGLALHHVEQRRRASTPREVLAESLHRACRYGLEATLWHDGHLRPVRDVAAAAVQQARTHLRNVGRDAAAGLSEVERILADGNGADQQRAAYARGGMDAVLRQLVDATGAPPVVDLVAGRQRRGEGTGDNAFCG